MGRREAESGEEHKRLAEAVGQAEQARSLEAKKWEQDMKEREERLQEERAQLQQEVALRGQQVELLEGPPQREQPLGVQAWDSMPVAWLLGA